MSLNSSLSCSDTPLTPLALDRRHRFPAGAVEYVLTRKHRTECSRYCDLRISGELPIPRSRFVGQQLLLDAAANRKGETMGAINYLLSAALLMTFVGPSEAANGRTKQRRQNSYYYYNPPTTTATERQLRNQQAYERGEYYEHDSNALPFGSRAWWEQKQREGRDEH